MGKGGFDGNSDIYMGMLGMHGTKTANLGVTECDLLISLGCRFSDRVTGNAATFARKAKIIHFDIDEAEINKTVKTAVGIIGDLKESLKAINKKLETIPREEWISHIHELKEKYPLAYDKSVLSGPYVMEKIYELTNGDAIITTDVGQHQMWAAQYFKYSKPRTFISSGGLGTMGYGLGACIGAKVGRPDKKVINIAGDGCFRMNMNEIATATRYDIPIIQIVLNNKTLGMVRQWQTLFYQKRYSFTTLNDKVDFVKVSEGLGAKAYRVNTKEEFESVMKEALTLNEPVMIECMIGTDEKVWPMVAPNTSIGEAFSEEDLKDKGLA
jgi:acetolactate synthase-1/2/3 large subunit